MINKQMANALSGMVPERVAATVTLKSDTASDVAVSVTQAWRKPLKTTMPRYGGVYLSGTEEIINVLDSELNPSSNGRRIKPLDEITIGSEVLVVQHATLKSVRTRWECLVNRKAS